MINLYFFQLKQRPGSSDLGDPSLMFSAMIASEFDVVMIGGEGTAVNWMSPELSTCQMSEGDGGIFVDSTIPLFIPTYLSISSICFVR